MNKILLKIVIIMVLTAFLGELKITPFNSSFRFGLGGAVFFFLLLFYKNVPYLLTGILTGLFTTCFRIGLDYISIDSFTFVEAFRTHSPIIGYYVVFSFFLQFVKKRNLYQSPILLGVIGTLCDGAANLVELGTIYLVLQNGVFIPKDIQYVGIVAILRSFFVVGLFNMIQTNKLKAVFEEQQSRFEQVQSILSELYIEAFFLKKSLKEIEIVTAKGYNLYNKLKNDESLDETATLALCVTQEFHEIKKDNQRIVAGLEKVFYQESVIIPIHLSEVIHLSTKSNQKYIESLNKDIVIKSEQLFDLKLGTVYPMLIIINNLISNAIEAIPTKGYITLNVKEEKSQLIIAVTDNGEGIFEDERDVIFEPGFTTKFDENGNASTGIGLSHVNSMVEELYGSVRVHSLMNITTFIVCLPINVVELKEEDA